MDRRNFLKLLGITSGTALISSCGVDKANEKLIPYVIPPEEDVYPGKPLYINTTCTECPANCGMEVRVNEKVYHDQRDLFPTKLEGIEGHPINDGSLCMRGQSGLHRLYNRERVRRPMMRDQEGNWRVATWQEVIDRIRQGLREAKSNSAGNLFLSGRTTGTLSELIDAFASKMNVERLPEFELFSYANIREANRLVFNRNEIPYYNIENCDYLLTLGADLFETFVSPISYANQFGKAIKRENFTWYHLEPHLSLTGLQANRRFVIHPKREMLVLAFLLRTVLGTHPGTPAIDSKILDAIPDMPVNEVSRECDIPAEDLQKMAMELAAARRPLVICGGVSTAHEYGLETALLAALLQKAMGMTGNTVDFTRAENYNGVGNMLDMKHLTNRLQSSNIGVLFISRTNPVYQIPDSEKFKAGLQNAGLTVGMFDMMNETAGLCDVVLPLSHPLESWGDEVPRRGLRTAIQPAIDPQFDSKSEGDVLLELMEAELQSGGSKIYKDYIFEKWNSLYGEDGRKEFLQIGFKTEAAGISGLSSDDVAITQIFNQAKYRRIPKKPFLVFMPSIRAYDGRGKDLMLLNELPDPLTTISWGEWISISKKNAKELNLKTGDEVEINFVGKDYRYPVKVQDVVPDDVYTMHLNMIQMTGDLIDPRTGDLFWYAEEVSIKKTGGYTALPVLSGSENERNRGVLYHHEESRHHEEYEKAKEEWYPEHEHVNYRWGMTIDLESCIGCGACAAACYVENNLAITGRKDHLKGREMSWMRIEPFVEKNKFVEFVPMLCQQCDDAPCEPVCPVFASYHNNEGLNVQVYNRCVGTRYCSNNCPYKARRFNWFDYRLPEPLDKMYNPNVSVRTRGIMEKCSFCVQRIRHAKDHAKDENRLVQDGEITPACAQTCPTNAITFGNLKDENSRVSKLSMNDRAYRALEELGTKPAIHYLRNEGMAPEYSAEHED